ncbi:MAG: hypothetical protein QXO51_07480 [Halobacteria archaeon]
MARTGFRRTGGKGKWTCGRGKERTRPLPTPDNSAQLIIVTGFIVAIALIAVTVMLNDIIYATNTASIETLRSTKFDAEEVLALVRQEVAFTRRSVPDADGLALHMTNFTRNLSKLYGARGIAVDLNWSGAVYGNSAVRNTSSSPAAIAYCGDASRGGANESGLRTWMTDLGLNFTDYSFNGRCDDQTHSAANRLFVNLCRGSVTTENNWRCNTSDPTVALNVSTVIFEFDQLSPKYSIGIYSNLYCGSTDNDSVGGNFLNRTQCQTLQNWTYLGGTLIKTGSNDTSSPNNTSILDLFTVSYHNAATRPPNAVAIERHGFDVRRVVTAPVSAGCLVNNSTTGALKNAPNESLVNFSRGGLVFQRGSSPPTVPPNLTTYISEAADDCDPVDLCDYGGTGVCGIAVNWTYGSGKIYHFPHLQGELRNSNRVIINDPDNLRPIFNLFPHGGDCRIVVKVSLGGVTYTSTLYC